MVTNAVNVPAVAADDSRSSGRSCRSPRSSARSRSSSPEAARAVSTSPTSGELAEHDTRLLTSPRSTAPSRDASTRPSTTSTRRCSRHERGIEVARGAPPRLPRLHEPRCGDGGRGRARRSWWPGTTIGRETEPRLVRALGYEIEIELEPTWSSAVNDDRARPDRPAGHAPRRGGREHRQHGRLADRRSAKALMALTARQHPGDGAHRAAAQPSRASSMCASSCLEHGHEQRVARTGRARRRVPARAARRGAPRGVLRRGTPTASDAAEAVGCDARADREVARLHLRRDAGRSCSFRATGAPTRQDRAAAGAARRRRSPAPTRSRGRPASSRGRSRRFRSCRESRRSSSTARCSLHEVVWVGAGSTATWRRSRRRARPPYARRRPSTPSRTNA